MYFVVIAWRIRSLHFFFSSLVRRLSIVFFVFFILLVSLVLLGGIETRRHTTKHIDIDTHRIQNEWNNTKKRRKKEINERLHTLPLRRIVLLQERRRRRKQREEKKLTIAVVVFSVVALCWLAFIRLCKIRITLINHRSSSEELATTTTTTTRKY